jgi:hypothetical protein
MPNQPSREVVPWLTASMARAVVGEDGYFLGFNIDALELDLHAARQFSDRVKEVISEFFVSVRA